jgi:3-oxoacyl-[acyl-carrier protein] reductase
MRLKDRVAIVTGAGQGIGKATALEFAKEGANVVVCDVSRDTASDVVSSIETRHSRAMLAVADVTKEDEVNEMVRSVLREFGRVDILVNNVGGVPKGLEFKPFAESTIDEIRRFVELNLFGSIICARAVVNHMIERRYGKIVNISSIVAALGQMKGLGYSTAKSALEGFTISLAKEVGEYGINVNCIMPGLAETPALSARKRQLPDRYKQLCDWSHLGRLGRPEEFARVIVFLASDDSSFMSGATVPVEGGILKIRPM